MKGGVEMRRVALLGLLSLLVGSVLISQDGWKIELVKTIGDERPDYTFFKVTGGAIGPQKQIYVADSGGYFIAEYDWDGQFVRRLGRLGQGPGEFQRVGELSFHQDTLYFNDNNNRRIGKCSQDLSEVSYIPLKHLNLRGSMKILDAKRMLCTFSDINNTQGKGQVAILDESGEILNCFFRQTQFGDYQKPKSEVAWAIRQITSKVLATPSPDGQSALVAFEYPTNPMVLYLYSLEGKEKTRFSIPLPRENKFPDYFMTYPITVPGDKFCYVIHSSLHTYQDFYLLHLLYKENSKSDDSVVRTSVLVLDQKGVKVTEIELDPMLRLLGVGFDGYLIGTTVNDEDEPVVVIYKLSI